MGTPKRVTDLTLDPGAVADTDYTIIDSVAEGTRKVPMTAVKTYTGSGFTNPMTSVADIIVGGTAGAAARLAKGSALQVLRVNAGATALEYGSVSAALTCYHEVPFVTMGSSTRDLFTFPMPAGGLFAADLEITGEVRNASFSVVRWQRWRIVYGAENTVDAFHYQGAYPAKKEEDFITAPAGGTLTIAVQRNGFLEDPTNGYATINCTLTTNLTSPVRKIGYILKGPYPVTIL